MQPSSPDILPDTYKMKRLRVPRIETRYSLLRLSARRRGNPGPFIVAGFMVIGCLTSRVIARCNAIIIFFFFIRKLRANPQHRWRKNIVRCIEYYKEFRGIRNARYQATSALVKPGLRNHFYICKTRSVKSRLYFQNTKR